MDHSLRITSRHLGLALLPKLQLSYGRPLSISPCLYSRALHPCPAFCRISVRNHWNGRWENSKNQRWWSSCEVAPAPRSHLSILRDEGTSGKVYSRKHFSPLLYLLHQTPLKPHLTSSRSFGFPWAMAVATSRQVYPESTNTLQAHIFCLCAFLPSLGKTRPEPA